MMTREELLEAAKLEENTSISAGGPATRRKLHEREASWMGRLGSAGSAIVRAVGQTSRVLGKMLGLFRNELSEENTRQAMRGWSLFQNHANPCISSIFRGSEIDLDTIVFSVTGVGTVDAECCGHESP